MKASMTEGRAKAKARAAPPVKKGAPHVKEGLHLNRG